MTDVIIEISERVEALNWEGTDWEVMADARARFHESTEEVEVELSTWIRDANPRVREARYQPGWLPKPESVRAQASRSEASALAKEVFHRWAQRVRASAEQQRQRMTSVNDPVS